MNPDCRDGKHRSCSGDGWDETTDGPARCSCTCHLAAWLDENTNLQPWQFQFIDQYNIHNAPITPHATTGLRRNALAAKAARTKGPPSSSSWRGKERNTKYASKQ